MANREKVLIEILENQLKYTDYTYAQIQELSDGQIDGKLWCDALSITPEQHQAWEKFTLKLLKKKLHYKEDAAKQSFSQIYLNWGIRIQPNEKK